MALVADLAVEESGSPAVERVKSIPPPKRGNAVPEVFRVTRIGE
jgi:hypothetical protein